MSDQLHAQTNPSGVFDQIDDLAIVICSCDAYRDTWRYVADSWDQYWPECPFPVYLVSEVEAFSHPRIQNLRLGRPLGWSDMLLEAMQHVEQNRIIYLQDDYLLKGPTDAEALAQMLEAFAVLEADYLRIFPWPSATEPHPNYPNIGDLGVEQPYRTSLQAAIWRKSVLVNLLQAGESGHQFEERSPGRAAAENYRFFGICDPDVSFATMNDRRYSIDYYATAIFQGKWLGDAIRVLAENRISIDPRPRGILNRWDYWLFTRTIGQSGARVSLLRLIDRCIFKQPIVNLTLTRLMMRDGKVSRWLAPVANENSMVTAER